MKILEQIKSEVNYLFFRRYRYHRVERRHLAHYYSHDSSPARSDKPQVIFMADGRRMHGGLADRLRGICSLYESARNLGMDFRIYFRFPFRLEDYLVPAGYDWRIADEDVSYSNSTSRPVYMDTRGETDLREKRWQRHYFEKAVSDPAVRQFHCYSSFFFAEERFGELFSELFKPSPALEKRLAETEPLLGKHYISVSTRFLELLGDFDEPRRERFPLAPEEQKRLIEGGVNKIREIRTMAENRGKKVLVTSDSMRFLAAVSGVPDVVTIPGRIAHIDRKESDGESEMKTFVDFFAIARADSSYLLIGPGMYRSNFSKRAAQAGSHPFNEIFFDHESDNHA